MINMTEMISNKMNINNLEICHLNQLFEISTLSKAIATTSTNQLITNPDSYTQLISILIASLIGICSMTYGVLHGVLSRYCNQGLTLHFVGIRRPNNFSKSQYKLLDNVDTASTMITVKTPLKASDTISVLKQLIQKTYCLPTTDDILISYSNHIVNFYQECDTLTLDDFGIANNSLLTLAVCQSHEICQSNGKYSGIQRGIFSNSKKCSAEPVQSVNQMFDMFQDEEDEQWPELEPQATKTKGFLEPFIGFDVIMQQGGVLVYKMPNCGHEMQRNSLYEYALNTFQDNNNVKLHCPHGDAHGSCAAEWDFSAVLQVLRHECSTGISEANVFKIEDEALMKLELLSSRNVVENNNCNVQKCPRCKTLYFKNKSDCMQLEEIKTVFQIEKEFKTQCIFCKTVVPQYPDVTDMERAKQINAMFGMFEEEENEEFEMLQEEKRKLETGNAINKMFGMFVDDEEEKYNDNANGQLFVEETYSFCFCCGGEWSVGHICDNSFRRDLIDILEKAPAKKIGRVDGVPSIRCCPSPTCCQLLFHIAGCKHMKCRACKTNFCMVCMKQPKDGQWQCGGSSTVCPVAQRQNIDTLPDNIVITKQKFTLFDDKEKEDDSRID